MEGAARKLAALFFAMGFLDNLENDLKAMESLEERSSTQRRPSADQDRARSRAVQPHAEQLRQSTFVKELLDRVVVLAHELRTKVYINWAGNALRLDAREHRMELQPTPNGIVAVFWNSQQETGREPVDLGGDPEKLARRFLSRIEPRAKTASVEDS
jgi:hypothetical protein